jgi:hypothetical protein
MPSILLMARFRPAFSIDEHTMPAILLLLLGTLTRSAMAAFWHSPHVPG